MTLTNNEMLYSIIRTYVRAILVRFRKPTEVTRNDYIHMSSILDAMGNDVENDQTDASVDILDALEDLCESLRSENIADIKHSCNSVLREIESVYQDRF